MLMTFNQSAQAGWKPANGPLMTRWAKDVSPTNALPEYPRPQMVRAKWENLNGLWQFAAAKDGEQPPVGKELAEQILVPYPVESALSGLMRHEERMWYRRRFDIPAHWNGQHVLLHFGAVDWHATVYLNGKEIGQHKGGYDGFSFDITDALKPGGPQELIVGVFDGTDKGDQPRGKQTANPRGIWYTPTSGIWQTIWMEPVAPAHITAFTPAADVDRESVGIKLYASKNGSAEVRILDGDDVVGRTMTQVPFWIGGPKRVTGNWLVVSVPHAKLWSPESPFLYRVEIDFTAGDGSTDHVTSYFAFRKISVGKDDKGIPRIFLNNKPIFMTGPLDQGFWPDGLYTAPTDEALRYDIEVTKKLGFNMTRKHVKVEPERWYYWADKLGLLVWQDMPSMRTAPTTDEQKQNFESELDHLIEGRREHPSIVMWVVFNEGWGQFQTARLTQHVKQLDPTRLVNNASGWDDQNVGDVIDKHHYPDPAMPNLQETRAAVLGEFGGLKLVIPDHTWAKTAWGYRESTSITADYEVMFAQAWKLRDKGLCAAVYTQITDVETECNGLLTYDRAIIKPDLARAAAVNSGHIEGIVIPATQPAR
jgi:beta-galactosidase/beta-glucuronidase